MPKNDNFKTGPGAVLGLRDLFMSVIGKRLFLGERNFLHAGGRQGLRFPLVDLPLVEDGEDHHADRDDEEL